MDLRYDEQENEDYYDERGDDDDLGKGRIKFSRKRLYGREADLARLDSAYHKLQSTREDDDDFYKTQIVLLSGLSGTGKSSIVLEFLKQFEKRSTVVENQESPLVAIGKYDEQQNADPYSAITEAMSKMCSDIVCRNKGRDKVSRSEIKELREDLKEGVGDDGMTVLTSLFPDLEDIVGGTDDSSSRFFQENIKREHALNRLKYVFLKFMSACCTQKRPMILFLDDLQWADEASLDLLDSLLRDRTLTHLLFIGAFRSNEVDEDRRLFHILENIEQKRNDIKWIEVKDLSEDDIAQFVGDSLSLEPEAATELTGVIYSKTNGNILFVRETLEELCRKNAIYYDVIVFRWEWNLSGVELEARLSESVVDALRSRILHLPEKLQKTLAIASFTKSTFDAKTLLALMEDDGYYGTLAELTNMLHKAVRKGLLVHHAGAPNYSFAHDNFQQAASSLVTGDTRDKLRVRIAKRLMELSSSQIDSEGGEWRLFVAADHLNSVRSHDVDWITIARLNLEVGDLSVSVSAMQAASTYFEKSIEALHRAESNPWSTHYELCLRLHRIAADVELALGNAERGYSISEKVLQNASTLDDKLPTYISYGLGLGRHERHREAIRVNKEALYLLGELPKKFLFLHLIRNFALSKRRFMRVSDEEILQITKMTNERKVTAMELLHNMSVEAFIVGDFGLLILGILLRIRLTFQDGLCAHSAIAFAAYGFVLCTFGDQEGGSRMARLATQAVELTGGKHLEATVYFMVSHFLECWKAPIASSIENFKRGYKSGRECGDLRSSTYNLMSITKFHLIGGSNLRDVLRLCNRVIHEAAEREDMAMASFIQPLKTFLTHLIGETDELPAWGDMHKLPDHAEGEIALQYYLYRLQLAYYLGQFEVANRLSGPLREITKHDTVLTTTCERLFFAGLSASALARKTGKRCFSLEARKLTQEMETIMAKRGRVAGHRTILLNADRMAYRNTNVEKVKEIYDNAISAARDAGFGHDEALGSELAGEYFLQHGNRALASRYLTNARDLYTRWGALGKVNQLISRLQVEA